MNLKRQVEGLNAFLTEVYGTEMRLSQLLQNLGFSESQITVLRERHLNFVIDAYIALVKELLVGLPNGDRLYLIASRRFNFDGDFRATLQSLGTELDISRERVRQLEIKIIRRCKSKQRRRLLEDGFVTILTAIVGVPVLERHNVAEPDIPTEDINDEEGEPQTAAAEKVDPNRQTDQSTGRENFKRTHEKWSPEEDEGLKFGFEKGKSL